MSEGDIDRILSKYENRPLKFKNQSLQITERKTEEKSRKLVSFMNEKGTPMKELNSKEPELLRKLDQAERSLMMSERKSAQIFKQYDIVSISNKELENELDKERRSHLQDLIDLQNKLMILEKQNNHKVEALQDKDHKIAVLKQKLLQKDDQLAICSKELQQTNKKISSTILLKEQQSSELLKRERQEGKVQNHRSLVELTQKYERQLSELKKQVKRFDNIFIEKEKQKKQILIEMEEMAKNHQVQLAQARNAIVKNEEQYRKWLDQAKQQKIQITQKYEQQLQEVRKNLFNKIVQPETEVVSRNIIKGFEKQIKDVQAELYEKKSEVETLVRADKENTLKVKSLEAQISEMKGQYSKKLLQVKKYIGELEESERIIEKQRQKANSFEINLQKQKNKYVQILEENQRIKQENENLKRDMKIELKSLTQIRRELNSATDSQINMNATLTEGSMKLKNKIKQLELQVQGITAQLYAERLQNAKLKEEIKETKVQLRRQYEVSIQNTRKELERKIKQNHENILEEQEKEDAYLQLRQLQHKYQKMTSEVVTVDELLKTATKIHKYYKR